MVLKEENEWKKKGVHVENIREKETDLQGQKGNFIVNS